MFSVSLLAASHMRILSKSRCVLGLLFFSEMTRWCPFCCLKQWFLKPVNRFWDLRNLSTFQLFLFFGNSDAVFSRLFVFLLRIDQHYYGLQSEFSLALLQLPINGFKTGQRAFSTSSPGRFSKVEAVSLDRVRGLGIFFFCPKQGQGFIT